MSKPKIIAPNPHLDNLIKKTLDDYDDSVGKQKDGSNMLLRGHLYVENLIDEVLATYDTPAHKIQNQTFSSKLKTLEEISRKKK